MSGRKKRPTPKKATRRGPKADTAKKALVEQYFADQRERARLLAEKDAAE